MMKFLKMNRYSLIALFLGVLIAVNTLYIPKKDNDEGEGFSSDIALHHIEQISKQPHSVHRQENLNEVRLYIEETLISLLGENNVNKFEYNLKSTETSIINYLGVIEGNSETAILLIAHYDSGTHWSISDQTRYSYGAADDGYGVATLLEVARIFNSNELENSIYVLFTDAEEVGLLGAKRAIDERFNENVGLVINVEARGLYGPVYMFETGHSNKKLLDFYKKAKYPMAYSISTAIYNKMPNNTDYSVYKERGYNGMNFAVLGGSYYYHTAYDNSNNISVSSISHYGHQITSLVKEFTGSKQYSNKYYFDADEEYIFFTFIFDKIIAYSQKTSLILGLVLIITVLLKLLNKSNIDVSKRDGLLAFLLVFAFPALTAILTNLYVQQILKLSRVRYDLLTTRIEHPEIMSIPIFGIISTLLVWSYYKLVKRNCDTIFKKVSCLTLAGLSLYFTVVFPGASFIFLVPALISGVILTFELISKNDKFKMMLRVLEIAVLVGFLIPFIYSLLIGVGFGGLFITVTLFVVYLQSILSSMRELKIGLEDNGKNTS